MPEGEVEEALKPSSCFRCFCAGACFRFALFCAANPKSCSLNSAKKRSLSPADRVSACQTKQRRSVALRKPPALAPHAKSAFVHAQTPSCSSRGAGCTPCGTKGKELARVSSLVGCWRSWGSEAARQPRPLCRRGLQLFSYGGDRFDNGHPCRRLLKPAESPNFEFWRWRRLWGSLVCFLSVCSTPSTNASVSRVPCLLQCSGPRL